ncbi:MAG: ArsC family reductase [Rhodospirillaceae bacterium]|nr:MAG: ArsC family reductase [Rhodospirillaceae bacterium]
MLTVYGIKNCDTVRKALKWLDANGTAYTFHDFRKDGLETATVQRWVDALGWESVLNKRSTTWRQLSEKDKSSLNDVTVVRVLVDNPTLVKRPVFESKEYILQGFTDAVRSKLS